MCLRDQQSWIRIRIRVRICFCSCPAFPLARMFATSKSSPLLSLPSLEMSIDENSDSEIKTLVSFFEFEGCKFLHLWFCRLCT